MQKIKRSISYTLSMIIIAFSLNAYHHESHKIEYGIDKQISFRPDNSPLDFHYDVLYFIPASLKGKKDIKALVFLHGGGASTRTREGSLRVTRQYYRDLKSIAQSLGIMVVLPSASGLNWTNHSVSFLKSLNQFIKSEFPVDKGSIALSGHSMGGMAITRYAHWLASEYAFFLSVAAGMDDSISNVKIYERSYFDVRYHHMQGSRDHFKDFLERTKRQQKRIREMESSFKEKSLYTMEIYQGGHEMPRYIYKDRLKKLFNSSRVLAYQKNIKGVFYHVDRVHQTAQSSRLDYYEGPRDHYFWLKAQEFESSLQVINFEASLNDNTIVIRLSDGLKKLRVFLDEKMINLQKPINIYINGVLYQVTSKELSRTRSANDLSYYHYYTDLTF